MRRSTLTSALFLAVVFASVQPALNAQYAPAPPSYQEQQQSSWPQVEPYSQGSSEEGPNAYPEAQGQPGYQQPQQPTPQDYAADRQHGVGRISVADGQVSVKRGDSGELVAAAINAPLLAQDRLQTSPQGRAEVELDHANVVRLGPNTDLGFADVQYRRYQMQLGAGTIIYRVLRDSGAQSEIDTPSVALHPQQPGEYRISVYDDGATQVTVRSGAIEVMGSGGSQVLGGGQSMLVRGNSNNPQFENVAAPQFDQLDGWSRDRDQPLMYSRSYQYVSPDVAGAQDLDQNGTWVQSQYGEAWHPSGVDADWSPYSTGSWAYEPYYGWTWVDSAAWGWAPYHYGRWFHNGGLGWCWWPGAGIGIGIGWSPALVGWFGFGGGLGWVPLAPFEFGPRWWGLGFGFGFGRGWDGWGRGGIWGSYRNAGFRGGARFASYSGFSNRGGRFAAAGRAELGGASMLRGRLPIQPTRASYGFSNRAAMANPRLAGASQRSFFSSSKHGSQYGGFSARPGNYGSSYGRSSANAWHSFGQPGASSAARQGVYQQGGGTWHSFGQSEHGVPAQRSYGYAQGSPASRSYSGYAGSSNRSYAAPRYSTPNYSGGSQQHYSAAGGSHYSAPHYSSQHSSAPRASAPHSSGGSSHGGGGSSHSSGGGHHR